MQAATTSLSPLSGAFTVDVMTNILHASDGGAMGAAFPGNGISRVFGLSSMFTGPMMQSSSAQAVVNATYKGGPALQWVNTSSGAPVSAFLYPAVPVLTRPVAGVVHGTGFDVVSYRMIAAFVIGDKRGWFDFRLATSGTQVPIVIDGAQAGFGLRAMPGNVMHFVSRRNDADGALAEDSALDWPGDPTEYHHVEWRITSATPTRDAKVELIVDGKLILSRSWGAGTVLPDYTGKANAQCFRCFVEAEGGSVGNDAIYARHVRYIAAPFGVALP